jgi:CheY-like chemotaxis protein
MPVMDGFELKAMLDERPGERIPFIAIAGTDSPERHELAKKLGVAALLGKPIQVREFCRVVRGTLMPAS